MPKYEAHLLATYATGLLGYFKLGDSAAPANDESTNNFDSVANGTGVTFNNAAKIPNTDANSVLLSGASAQTYIQLESAPGSRFRATQFTINLWFKRAGAGVTVSTGTGGITAEPLLTKGGAESETSGLNCNYFIGLETLGTGNLYLSADFEKDNSGNTTEKPTGRNGRMLDVSVLTNVFTLRAHTQATAGEVAHTFNDGDRVRFGGTAITGITAATWYYIVSANQGAGTFQVSATSGGAPLTGLGTVTAGGGAWFNHAKNTVSLATTNTDWHMGTLTWDGTNLKTYLDGVLAENEVPTMSPPEATSQQLCAIAALVTSGGTRTGAFNGNFQHVSVHNIALTGANVTDLYTVGTTAAPADPTASLLTPATRLPQHATTIAVKLVPASGRTIDDATVFGTSVQLKKGAATLVQGTDYSYAYDTAKNRITLTPTGIGTYFPLETYTVVLNPTGNVTIADDLATVLPANTQVVTTLVALQYDCPDNAIDYGLEWENWTVDGSGSVVNDGSVVLRQTGTTEFATINVYGLTLNATYWCSVYVSAKSAGANGNLRVVDPVTDGTAGFDNGAGTFLDLTATAGTRYFFKLRAVNPQGSYHKLILRHTTSPDGETITFTDFRVYPVAARSSAKVAVMGDREGGYNAAAANAAIDAVLHADADSVNCILLGDTGGTGVTIAAANDRLKLGPAGNNGLVSRGGFLYPAIGNHDYDANGGASGGQTENDFVTYYDLAANNNGGKKYFSKELGEMDFFFFNTCSNSEASPEAPENGDGWNGSLSAFEASASVVWLDGKEDTSMKRWHVAVIHHAAYSSGSPADYAAMKRDWRAKGYHLVLQAHIHNIERLFVSGMAYYTIAMGGGTHHGWGTVESGSLYRVLGTAVTDTAFLKLYDSTNYLTVELLDSSNNLLDRQNIGQAQLEAVGRSKQAIWNTRANVGNARQNIWNVRAIAGRSRAILFDVRNTVGLSRQVRFNVLSPVNFDLFKIDFSVTPVQTASGAFKAEKAN